MCQTPLHEVGWGPARNRPSVCDEQSPGSKNQIRGIIKSGKSEITVRSCRQKSCWCFEVQLIDQNYGPLKMTCCPFVKLNHLWPYPTKAPVPTANMQKHE